MYLGIKVNEHGVLVINQLKLNVFLLSSLNLLDV